MGYVENVAAVELIQPSPLGSRTPSPVRPASEADSKINPGSAELGGIVTSIPPAFASDLFGAIAMDTKGHIAIKTQVDLIFKNCS